MFNVIRPLQNAMSSVNAQIDLNPSGIPQTSTDEKAGALALGLFSAGVAWIGGKALLKSAQQILPVSRPSPASSQGDSAVSPATGSETNKVPTPHGTPNNLPIAKHSSTPSLHDDSAIPPATAPVPNKVPTPYGTPKNLPIAKHASTPSLHDDSAIPPATGSETKKVPTPHGTPNNRPIAKHSSTPSLHDDSAIPPAIGSDLTVLSPKGTPNNRPLSRQESTASPHDDSAIPPATGSEQNKVPSPLQGSPKDSPLPNSSSTEHLHDDSDNSAIFDASGSDPKVPTPPHDTLTRQTEAVRTQTPSPKSKGSSTTVSPTFSRSTSPHSPPTKNSLPVTHEEEPSEKPLSRSSSQDAIIERPLPIDMRGVDQQRQISDRTPSPQAQMTLPPSSEDPVKHNQFDPKIAPGELSPRRTPPPPTDMAATPPPSRTLLSPSPVKSLDTGSSLLGEPLHKQAPHSSSKKWPTKKTGANDPVPPPPGTSSEAVGTKNPLETRNPQISTNPLLRKI